MIYLRVVEVLHTFENLSTKDIILFSTSPQSEVWTRSYGPLSHGGPNFGNFGTPNLRIPGQNDIWA
jgi:hypothetical protein